MNRERAKELLPIIQAFVDGKTIQSNPGGEWEDYNGDNPIYVLRDWRIKPLEFPPLPEGLEWHNPDGLTPEQVGEYWRLLTTAELDGKEHKETFYWSRSLRNWFQCGHHGHYYSRHIPSETLRVPIATPLPKQKKKVPLGPEDFQPGCAIRQSEHDVGWVMVGSVGDEAVTLEGQEYSFQKLADGFYQIKRPGEDWTACKKEA